MPGVKGGWRMAGMDFGAEKKYLAISCLQKSIRRGETELSRAYASRLFDLDRSYLCYRLAVMLVEDISFGDLDLVKEYFDTEFSKKNIDGLGGKEYVIGVVARAAAAPKDKTPWEAVHQNFNFMANGDLGAFGELRRFVAPALRLKGAEPALEWSPGLESEILQAALDENAGPHAQALAWNLLIGNAGRSFNGWLARSDPDPGRLARSIEALADKFGQSWELGGIRASAEAVGRIAQVGQKWLAEDMFAGFPAVYAHLSRMVCSEPGWKSGKWGLLSKARRPFGNSEMLAGTQWFSPGVDKHCHEGSQALRRFMDCAPVKAFCAKAGLAGDLAQEFWGHLLFRLDGGLLQDQLVYPMAISLYKSGDAGFMEQLNKRLGAGIAWEDCKQTFRQAAGHWEACKLGALQKGFRQAGPRRA